jgi:tripartite-type tricarboxylate transporter receptor subunit TctC
MKRMLVLFVATLVWLAGAQAAATAAAPVAAPAKKVEFPQKGKAINIIVGWATGGGADISARVLAAMLEKELQTPVTVTNKPGAASQIGATEIAAVKPDGYVLGQTVLPGTIAVYLDPARKATFNRKSFTPVALHTVDPIGIAVRNDSPFKSIKELVDYARTNPYKLKTGTGGVLSVPHLAALQLQKEAGIKLAIVHFQGGAQPANNLLGGHTDMIFDFPAVLVPHVKSGEFRPLAVMDRTETKFLPGVKTLESLGYKGYANTSRVYALPAGAPPEIADLLAGAIKRVMDTPEHIQKMEQIGSISSFLGPAETAKLWADMEEQTKTLMQLAAEEAK